MISLPSPNRNGPDAKPLSAFLPIDCSIAIDPIKYIGVSSSFYDFKPDSNVIDNDRMPGKPSLPACSVFGAHSHFMILSFIWFADETRRTARVGDRLDQVMSWISSCFEFS
jgi:hypothetical protein